MADHAGMLKKLGGGSLMKQQQDRYFELCGRFVYYYKRMPESSADKPVGEIDLQDTIIRDDERNPLSWIISGPLLAKEYTLTAESVSEKAEWVAKLRGWQDTAQKAAACCSDEARSGVLVGRKVSLSDFESLSVIGKGAFGKVRMVRKLDTGAIFAMKAMSKEVIRRENLEQHTKQEKTLLSRISHPFVVKLHFAFQDAQKLYLVLDFLSGGEVFFHLSNEGNFSESRAKFYTAQIASALGYLHGLDIIYRDLKPENCVLDKDGNCCLTDFGLAKPNCIGATAETFCGTPEYLAPEFLVGAKHGRAVDWWSLGILFYEMMYGLPPFYSEQINEMYNLILCKPLEFDVDGEEPPTGPVSEEAKALISQLLCRDVDTRMQTFNAFMSSPCYAGWDFDAMLRKEMDVPFIPEQGKLHVDSEFADDRSNSFRANDLKNDRCTAGFEGFTWQGEAPGCALHGAPQCAGADQADAA